jgi:hypothetical protein
MFTRQALYRLSHTSTAVSSLWISGLVLSPQIGFLSDFQSPHFHCFSWPQDSCYSSRHHAFTTSLSKKTKESQFCVFYQIWRRERRRDCSSVVESTCLASARLWFQSLAMQGEKQKKVMPFQYPTHCKLCSDLILKIVAGTHPYLSKWQGVRVPWLV